MERSKVLVVDDSALMRRLLSDILSSDPALEVVGTAVDPFDARDKIKQLHPDVLTLDIEMPKMDGISFLGNLMRLHPMPVVMISTLTAKGAELTLKALDMGAVDFIAKPKVDVAHSMEALGKEIIQKVKTAARANLSSRSDAPTSITKSCDTSKTLVKPKYTHRLIAIGASTGGTEAIKEVLTRLRSDCPPVVITQHIPPVFSQSFAQRMNQICDLTVHEAVDGQEIQSGHVYIAPGGHHLEVVTQGHLMRCRIHDEDPVNLHRPSVDVLFDSIAKRIGKKVVAAILTGMGQDGAAGLKRLKEAGAKTLAQNKDTCVVWGMPKAAVQMGAAESEVPLTKIASAIIRLAQS